MADGAHDHWVLKLRNTRLGLMVLRKFREAMGEADPHDAALTGGDPGLPHPLMRDVLLVALLNVARNAEKDNAKEEVKEFIETCQHSTTPGFVPLLPKSVVSVSAALSSPPFFFEILAESECFACSAVPVPAEKFSPRCRRRETF